LWNSAPNPPPRADPPETLLSMKSMSVGLMRKNEMLSVSPGASSGNFSPNSRATLAISSPRSRTAHSPVPWMPRALSMPVVWSSIVNATVGFCSTCCAVVVEGRVQKYSVGPSLT
jgi:hypothetical protein